jgi:hypothetical protein
MSQLQSDTIGEIATALSKAQATMGVALKDTTGQIGQNRGYKYADLASVINAARDSLVANDLAVVQRPQPSDKGICIQTTIVHASGEWIADGGLHLPLTKIDPQGAGSSITYARRYGLAAMLGIVQDDDDGAAAVEQQRVAREKAQRAANAPKLTDEQTLILSEIAKACGHAFDAADKLAEDYPKLVGAAVRYAVKQKAVDAADAGPLEVAALALDTDAVRGELAAVVA